MSLLQTMHAEVVAEITEPEMFAVAARDWLTSAPRQVFPDLWEGLRARPVVRDKPRPKADLDLPWGQPGHVLGTLTVYRNHPAFGGREVLYSDRAWQRLVAGLASYPFAVRLEINQLDSRGFPVHEGRASITVVRDANSPEWVRLTFSAMAVDTGWPESSDLQDQWAEFVKSRAAGLGALAGGMTDDVGPGQSALQYMTLNMATVDDSREVLRDYSWITIIATELGARLGGADALRASGAFYEVSALPNDSLWLRATPTINEFTGDNVRRVFEVLAPVLVTGEAISRFGPNPFRIVEGVDAADYR
jgi:hypothetical protein